MSCSIANANQNVVRYYNLQAALFCYTDDKLLREEITEALKNDDELVFGNGHHNGITLVRGENIAEALFAADWDDAARWFSNEVGSAYVNLEN